MPSLTDVNNGDLIINFDIVFPDSLEEERSKYLVKILPIPKKQVSDLQLEETPATSIVDKQMKEFSDKKFSDKKASSLHINELNDEALFDNDEHNEPPECGDGNGRQQVECATQ